MPICFNKPAKVITQANFAISVDVGVEAVRELLEACKGIDGSLA